jgi:flavin reductase (DIM6/NTAB) family NADH-FMN oxidoreductase RutF
MTLDSETLRRAMRAWTTGVAVITAAHAGQRYGMTVNSFTSISLEPPLISVTLKQLTHTHELVEKSGEFALTILSADQGNLSDRFAGKIPDITDRFEGVETETLLLDAPLIKGGMAYFNCRVVNRSPSARTPSSLRRWSPHRARAKATRWCITTVCSGNSRNRLLVKVLPRIARISTDFQ